MRPESTPEVIEPMMLKRPISADRVAAIDRRDADVVEIGRQVDGDEGDLEAADEEAGDEQLVGAVAEGLAERLEDRLVLLARRDRRRLRLAADDEREDSGMRSTIAAMTMSAVCQP